MSAVRRSKPYQYSKKDSVRNISTARTSSVRPKEYSKNEFSKTYECSKEE